MIFNLHVHSFSARILLQRIQHKLEVEESLKLAERKQTTGCPESLV